MRPWFYQGLQIKFSTLKNSPELKDRYIFLYSSYHVVVVEEDSSRQVRRRELGHLECFPAPSSHGETPGGGGGASGAPPHYYTAELPPSSLPEATPFTVGDNHTYNGYWNTPLDPSKNYRIYFQASSNFRGVSDPIWPINAHKDLMYACMYVCMLEKKWEKVWRNCFIPNILSCREKTVSYKTTTGYHIVVHPIRSY